jgi:hypothetical protein
MTVPRIREEFGDLCAIGDDGEMELLQRGAQFALLVVSVWPIPTLIAHAQEVLTTCSETPVHKEPPPTAESDSSSEG